MISRIIILSITVLINNTAILERHEIVNIQDAGSVTTVFNGHYSSYNHLEGVNINIMRSTTYNRNQIIIPPFFFQIEARVENLPFVISHAKVRDPAFTATMSVKVLM